MIKPDDVTPDHFRPHVRKLFRVEGGRHAFTLIDIDQRQLQAWEKAIIPRQPFNLIFSGPPGDVLPEGAYAFTVEGGPTFEFHVMPIHTLARDRQNYQAVFN